MKQIMERWERVVEDAQAGLLVLVVLGLSAFLPVISAVVVCWIISLVWPEGAFPWWVVPIVFAAFWLPALGDAFKKLGVRV